MLVVGPNEIQLTKVPPLDIAAIGTDLAANQSLNAVGTVTFSTDAIDSNNDISLPGYGFANGDTVQYTAGSDSNGTPISGLAFGDTYTVKVVDGQTFQLLDSSGNVVKISQVNGSGDVALGTQIFTDLTDTSVPAATVDLAYIDAQTNTVYVQDITQQFALNTPTEVNYESLADDGANAIGGLTNESYYNLVATSANSFVLQDETTGAVISLSDPGAPAVQGLSYISNTVTFNPVPVTIDPATGIPVGPDGTIETGSNFTGGVDSTTDEIILPAASLAAAGLSGVGLANGTPVIYETDPNVSTTLSLVFELNAINSTNNTIYIPGNGLANGAQVVYDAGTDANGDPNTPITGLVDGDTYTVVDVDPQPLSGAGYDSSDTFSLMNSNGQIVSISQGNSLGTQSFTDVATDTSATFTLARIDAATNTIDIEDHGFPGSASAPYAVNYAVLGGAGIGGLVNGDAYSLVSTGANTLQLYNQTTGKIVALSDSGAPSVTVLANSNYYAASGFGQNTAANGSAAFELDAINSANNTIYIAGNGLPNGATVTYDPGTDANGNPNTPINGLVAGGTYTVVDFNPTTGQTDSTLTTSDYFSLEDSTGKIVSISQGNALGTQTFTDATDNVAASVNLASISGNTITVEDHGFVGTTGAPEILNYETLAGAGIGGLTSGNTYNIVSTGTNTFQIYNQATNQVVSLSDPGAPSAVVISNMNGQGTIGDLTEGDVAISGLTDATTYYVVNTGVNGAAQFDSQGDQIIRLVSDPEDVANDEPIVLTQNSSSTSDKVQYALSPGTLIDGIGVQSSLTTSNTVKVQPQIGGKFNKETGFKNLLSRSDLSLATIFGSAQAQSGGTGALDSKGNVVQDIHNDSLSLGGGIGIIVTNNNVNAEVGNAGTTVLSTPNNVTVTSTNTQTDQSLVMSDVSKPKTSSGGAAVDLAFAVGVFQNTADATIFGDASIDAGQAINVTSLLLYPFVTQPDEIDSAQALGDFVQQQGASLITTDLLDGTLGLGTLFLNDWVVARAKAQGSQAAAIAGSIDVNVYTNNANAIVESGARLNQNMNAELDPGNVSLKDQSVSVTANVAMDLVEMAGIGKWSLNDSPLAKKYYEGKSAADQWAGGDIIDMYGRSGSTSVGGSVLVDSITDNVYAEIEGDAEVTVGSQGSLTLDANENIFRIAIATAGGKTDANSKFAFAGSAVALRQVSNVQAGLVVNSATSVGPTVTGGGTLTITAATGATPANSDNSLILAGLELEIAGSMIDAGSGADALGASTVVNDVTTNVEAFVGTDPTPSANLDPTKTTTGAVDLSVGNTSLSATTSGIWISVVATATVLTGSTSTPVDQGDTAEDPLDGISLPSLFQLPASEYDVESGYGLAGSAGINIISQTDLAYINAEGTINTGTLSLNADLDPIIVQFAGGVAVSLNDGKETTDGGTDIAGSFAINQINSDTESFIADFGTSGLTVTSTALDPAGGSAVTLTATRGGTLATFSAAVAANTNLASNAFSGSISVNRLVDTTDTLIDGVTLHATGSAALNALNNALVIAIGGGASYTAGAKGVGASLAFNQLSGDTESGVIGTKRSASVVLGGSLNATAINDQTLSALAVSLGISTGESGKAVAFTIAINVISTSQTIFTRDNSDGILAMLSNADVTASGVTLEAKDDSVILAVGGAIGVATQGQAYGIGLGWNQIALQVDASIDDSTVDAGAGGIDLQALSTQDGPISVAGKIAAAAIGGSVGNGVAIGGSLSVNGTYNTISATVSDSSLTTTDGGDVGVLASDTSTINALTGGAALSTDSTSVGAAIGANYIADDVTANVDQSTVNSDGSVKVDGEESAEIDSLTVGTAGGDDVSAGASVSVNVIDDPVIASITGAATDVSAQNNVTVIGQDKATIVAIAGALAAGGETGVGLSITEVTITDTTNAYIDGDSTVSADGDGAALTDVLGQSYQGVSIQANSHEDVVILAVGGAFSSEGRRDRRGFLHLYRRQRQRLRRSGQRAAGRRGDHLGRRHRYRHVRHLDAGRYRRRAGRRQRYRGRHRRRRRLCGQHHSGLYRPGRAGAG